jgi:AraC-like DNA-binding protein
VLDSITDYATGARVLVRVQAIRRTSLHAHPNALEIVYVLSGRLHVRVSSEDFDLEAGDYVAINRLDPHLLEGDDENITAVMHLDLGAFSDVDPFGDQIMFACESFDLPRYRGQEALLRGLLLDVVDLAVITPSASRLDARAEELVRLLCTGYSIEDYYQRDREPTTAQRAKLHGIVAAMRTNLASRDVLEDVATAHHYSKSYVSHFVKNTAAFSFSGMLTATRVMHAERLLLLTDDTMRDVSTQCGFSDVKYFTRSFAEWFKQTPAEYRAHYRPLTRLDDSVDEVDAETTASLVTGHRRRVASPTDPPRLSITPIVLRNVGSRADLFARIGSFGTADSVPAPATPTVRSRRHLLPMRVGAAELDGDHLLEGLASFRGIDSTPCLVVEYSGRDSTIAALAKLAALLRRVDAVDVDVWLCYNGLRLRDAVDTVIDAAEHDHGLPVQAVMVP